MSILEQILEYYPQSSKSVRVPNFDHCIIGFDEMNNRLVYDISLILGSMVDDGLTEDEAVEFLLSNLIGSSLITVDGPIFIHTFKLDL